MIDIISEKTLPDVLIHADHLPTLPSVAVEILQLSRNEKAGVEELADVIALDPAIAAKILKLANSAAYRRGSEVTSLARAALMLGMKAVQFLALSFSLTNGLPRRGTSGSFDYLSYWQYSVSMAVAGQELATLVQSPYRHEAFLCGLLGRFGQLVMAQAIPDHYATVLEQTQESLPTAAQEQALLGFNHHQVGSALLASWGLPHLLSDTIQFWEAPAFLPPGQNQATATLCRLIQMADVTSHVVWESAKEQALQKLHDYGYQYFGVAAVEIDTCFLSLESRLADTAGLFEIEVTGLNDFQSILTEARDQLVQLSLGTVQALEKTTERARELERENQHLMALAETDGLTGLRNRSSFDIVLQQVIDARVHANGETALGLLLIDIDHFKRFNDTYGHLLGDDVLKQVAERIGMAARPSDIVARYGGEEFVVLVPYTTIEMLQRIANRIRLRVNEGQMLVDGRPLAVTVSIGGACVNRVQNLEDGLALFKRADQCLYEAKDSGRNCVICREMLSQTES